MRLGWLVLTGVLLLMPTAALALDGDWHGTLAIPARGQLRLLLQFYSKDGKLAADLTSVDQGLTTLRAASASFNAHQIDANYPTIHASFHGVLDNGRKTITGHWTQSGLVLPLVLTPGDFPPAARSREPGDITIAAPGGTLGGTLINADGDRIAAVIINGSGPADRNGETPANKKPGTYRLLAEGLAAQGIATLRFDKRGVGESSAAAGPERSLRVQQFAGDVRLWAAELKRRTGLRCVWLIGHSEGALLAEMAAKDNSNVCGLVMLAGTGRKLGVILHEQLESRLPDNRKAGAFAVLQTLETGHTADPPLDMMPLFRPSVQPYLISEMALDPAALLVALKLPVLIIQGDADHNVSVADARALSAARPDATLKILPGVNHGMRSGAAPGALAPGLVDTIAKFVHTHSP
jgi:pimeloyl-ACP methyl ester carboxylesterase